MEFCCRVSQRETLKHLTHLIEEPAITPSKTHPVFSGESSIHQSTSETTKAVKDCERCESSQQKASVKPSAGDGHLFTTVVQHYSCASYPPNWHHPLSLAISHWEIQRGKSSENEGIKTQEASKSKTSQSQKTDSTLRVKSVLPESLPLRCPSPHMHRSNLLQ